MEIKHDFDFYSTHLNPDLRYNSPYIPAVVKEEIDLDCETGTDFYQSSLDDEEAQRPGLVECSQQQPWEACSINSLHRPELGLYLDSGSEENKFCDICGAFFYETSLYQTHMHLHTKNAATVSKNTPRDLPCPPSLIGNSAEWLPNLNTCVETFPVEATSNVNDSLVNTGEHLYACDICDQTFFYQRSLASHYLVHPKKRPYSCKFCEKTFIGKDNLASHHSTESPYSCGKCSKTFQHMQALVCHQMVHSVQRAYSCDICDITFKHQRTFDRHSLVHTGKQLYVCNICDQAFKRKYNLVKHHTVHSTERWCCCGACRKTFEHTEYVLHRREPVGERLHSCRFCAKTFLHETSLASHYRAHTEERPYSCNICGKTFAWKSYFKRHHSIHAKNSKPVTLNISS